MLVGSALLGSALALPAARAHAATPAPPVAGLPAAAGGPTAAAGDPAGLPGTAGPAQPQLAAALARHPDVQLPASFVVFAGPGDGVTDSAAALAAALMSLPATGGCIFFPPGTYLFSSAVSFELPGGAFSVSLWGSGTDATILNWPSAGGGLAFSYSGISNSVHLRDLSITTGQPDGGTAVTLSMSAAVANVGVAATSDMFRVTIRGDDGYGGTDYWSTGISISNVSAVQVDTLTVSGSHSQQGTGTVITGLPASGTFAVLLNIAKSNYVFLATGLVYGSFVQGVTVDQTNFTFVTTGISSAAGETGALVQLAVSNSQFNPGQATGGSGITTSTQIGALQIMNNFFVIGGPAQSGITLGIAEHFILTSNSIQGLNSQAATAISIGTTFISSPGIIACNDIFGFGAGGSGIVLSPAAVNVLVTGNTFTANDTNITNSGTGNRVISNPGYNPVGVQPLAAGPSPFTFTAPSSPETHYLTGGTLTGPGITVGGLSIQTVASGSPAVIHLEPGDSYTVSYTSPPAIVRQVH